MRSASSQVFKISSDGFKFVFGDMMCVEGRHDTKTMPHLELNQSAGKRFIVEARAKTTGAIGVTGVTVLIKCFPAAGQDAGISIGQRADDRLGAPGGFAGGEGREPQDSNTARQEELTSQAHAFRNRPAGGLLSRGRQCLVWVAGLWNSWS